MDRRIPASLAERRRWVVAPDQTDHPPGEMVLYWMHNAVRGHENPALDAAMWLAHENGLPLLVYHGLSEKYPYASDRHHAFILQGARDVQRELEAKGITYAFHLERQGHRGPHLRDLCRRAAVLVSEEMPVAPIACWVERLRSLVTTPIMLVDTTCVVPSLSIPTVPTRAFEFRSLIQDALADRLERPYEELPADVQPAEFTGPLGFESIDLQDVQLADLISRCKIDHSVGPVADTPGGTRAGYARWDRFRETSLSKYSERRNDADDPLGVSRLSGHLHYGMVSPFRIAREAAALGAGKYVDELVVWREMVFRFCLEHVEDLDTMAALPQWARESLVEHADDPREEVLDWESLARGKSSQSLWNLAQQSLLQHGELHNNLRMTWGKAFLAMTSKPCQALAQCIDLNHRYAIDGRSPISYSGILWCFGQFDRPFKPEQPVYGTVRSRSVDQHERRLDVPRFAQWVNRPIAATLPRVAIVGAGLGGLTAARTLSDHGLEVHVFEKSRGVGGRMATRRGESGVGFDHGAQYFTVRDDRFARYVRSWISQGLVAPWMQPIVELQPGGQVGKEKCGTPRYVGVPGMNAIAKHLAADVNVHLQTTVESLKRVGERWQLKVADPSGLSPDDSLKGEWNNEFDCVIVNCPPEQAASLLAGHSGIAATARQVEMLPCWSVMVRGEGLPELGFSGAFINEGPLSWIARNDEKPGRGAEDGSASAWVMHASADWSQQHLEQSPEWVGSQLLAAMQEATGHRFARVVECQAHRWRYANPVSPLETDCLWDATTGLGACGDWCGGPRIEGAFLSGMAMAGAVLRQATIDRAAASPGKLVDATTPKRTADAV
ncbi:Deoxyribodipyrimidine photolyase, type II [Rhodopirellula islandica]|uniref:Deoxyribodipyrimidine photolyase, type II n=1 Tax=Rhodopirellula islandica TaxID=595434 RepID=A0A0J1BNC2_RHOIS|nr:FAD-dependent oxidoreductase [Rhodopirellula islandica]KLU07935.1 Deoxyribodipyrimidine photolyase, type II [Rhodopirellula islandica]